MYVCMYDGGEGIESEEARGCIKRLMVKRKVRSRGVWGLNRDKTTNIIFEPLGSCYIHIGA